jgi:hypothetical protein
MSKALEFKKREAKDAMVKNQHVANEIPAIKQVIGKLFQTLGQLQNQLEQATASAKMADWRSLAILKGLDDVAKGKVALSDLDEAYMINKAEDLQIAAFDKESDVDDAGRKLEKIEGPAEKGQFAIARVRLFKTGEEVQDSQVIRTKFEIGKAELLPQVDEAVIGMNIGDSKRFPLALAGKTDEAEIALYGLRKLPITEPTIVPATLVLTPEGQADTSIPVTTETPATETDSDAQDQTQGS